MPDEYVLHGMPFADLIGREDFVTVLWWTWTGAKPSVIEHALIEACLVACMDHGEEPPSAQTTRIVASCGKPLADAVAAGMLTFGPRHGNAAGACSAWLRAAVASGTSVEETVRDVLEKKQRVPGFGHPVYETDPRSVALLAFAKKQLASTTHTDFAQAVSRALTVAKGKPLPLNVDGAVGAIVADIGAPPDVADAIFIVARTVGLIRQAREEMASGETAYRRGKKAVS